MSGVDVHLDGELVASIEDGDLIWHDGAHRYETGQPVLSVRLPRWTVAPPGARALVRAHLGSLLPEAGTAARHRLADRAGRATGDVETLLGVAGRDVPGAAVIVPRGADVPLPRYEPVDAREIADRLRRSSLGDHGGSSLPGVQPKGVLTLLDGAWYLPRGSAASTHILKPSRPDAPELVHDEAATSRAAAACGVVAAVSHVERFGADEDEVLVVPRFDRAVVDGQVRRTHQEDGASALGITPDDIDAKFERARAASSLRSLAAVLARHGGDRLDLLRQLTVRVLVGDTDGHVKNHGFLHRGDGSVGLAPLYDASPHAQRGATRLALRIDGRDDLAAVTLDDVVAEAVGWGVRPPAARSVVAEVRERFVDWLASADLHPLSAPSFAWVADHVAGLVPPGAPGAAASRPSR